MAGIGGKGPILLGVCWSMAFIGIILISLRAYGASRTPAGRWRWDFLWMALSALIVTPATAVMTVAVTDGLGNHVSALTLDELFGALHYTWITVFMGLMASMCAKFSVISLILGIENHNSRRWRRWALWLIAALIFVSTMVQLFVSLFQCDPYQKLWYISLPGTCPRASFAVKWSKLQGVVAGATDVVLALWPVTIVWSLQMSRRTKIGFCCLMAVGLFPGIVTFIRVTQVNRVEDSKDITYDFFFFMIWAVTEAWSVLILGSIPPLRPLFKRVFFGKPRATSTSDRAAHGYGKSSKSDQRESFVTRTVNQNGTEDEATNTLVTKVTSGKDGEHGEEGIMVQQTFVVAQQDPEDADKSEVAE